MQKCYEAIYDHEKLEWLGTPPNFQHAQMIVVTGDDEESKTSGKAGGLKM